jgi:hypothetical protein
MPASIFCLKGHYVDQINPPIRNWRQARARAEGQFPARKLPGFCTECGARNIRACPQCQAPIQYVFGGRKPAFCGGCGSPYPWTETALAAAKEYADELEQLNQDEKSVLKGTFEDLTTDTPRTELAVSRLKKFMTTVGPPAGAMLQKIVETIATEAAKKSLGL